MKSINIELLKPYQRNPRRHSPKQIGQLAASIRTFGFTIPILIDENCQILAGHGRLLAAKELGLKEVPVIEVSNLTEAQKKAYLIADNKLAENSDWNEELLSCELKELLAIDLDFDISVTGLEAAEIDILLHEDAPKTEPIENITLEDVPKCVKSGQIWLLGEHKLLCGDSLLPESFAHLLGEEKGDIVISDAPYNLKIDGVVRSKGKTKFKEFAHASGEMTSEQFTDFLTKIFKNLVAFSKDGSIHFNFMDFRHMSEILTSGKVYSELKNLCIWDKTSGGMGGFYRSQHELVFVYKNGIAPHTNNIELGKHGRYRTNIWRYPGVFINNKVNKEVINLHVTPKPVGLIADAIKDASKRGNIVLDPFGGSGATLLAAERTGRRARLIEIDPHYCDVILYRYERMTGKKAKKLEEEHEEL